MIESLTFAQTIILALTGIVIAWYTWETHQIRKIAIRQADQTERQIQILVEAQRPILTPLSGMGNFRGRRIKVRNVGGLARQIVVTVVNADPDIEADISPAHLATGDEGELYIRRPDDGLPLPSEASLLVTCNDGSGMTRTIRYKLYSEKNSFEEIADAAPTAKRV